MPKASQSLRRLPFLLILAGAGAGLFFLRGRISLDALAENSAALLAFRDGHYLGASLAFVALYITVVAFSLPGAGILSLAGGFLFGLFPGVLYNIAAATAGGILVFLAARAGFGADLVRRAQARGGAVARMQAMVAENQWSAMLTLRLIPVMPFFLVNLIAAFTGVRLRVFALATLVGILPAALIFTAIGAGLGDVLGAGHAPDPAELLAPKILLPLFGLALLAALPMLARIWRGRGARPEG